MAGTTKIAWADSTWNPVTGCTPISEGCVNCYARALVERFPQIHGWDARRDEYDLKDVEPAPFSSVRFHEDRLNIPVHWRKPRRVFVCSMGDLFHEDVPDSAILDVFRVMRRLPRHTFMILTKRPKRMRDFVRRLGHMDGVLFLNLMGGVQPLLDHVWFGVTAETQARAAERIPILLDTKAAVRFVSIEPMLGPISLSSQWTDYLRGEATETRTLFDIHGDPYLDPVQIQTPALNLVICGCETGPKARPMDLGWARSLRDQCRAAGVPLFIKQLRIGKRVSHDPAEWSEDLRIREGLPCIN